MNHPKPNIELAAKLNKVAIVLSIALLSIIVAMGRIKIDVSVDLSFLPAINAGFNIFTSFALIMALIFVKKKNIAAHKKMIFAAMISSFFFVLCYVAYHITSEPTSFCKEGGIRTAYYVLLITHIILAAIILPFVFFTFIRGFTYQVEKHKKMARWVYPIWLYVVITGPICYFMLQPCY